MVRLRIGVLIASAAIVFAACGGATSSSAVPPASQAPATSAEASAAASAAGGTPKDGGALIVQNLGDVLTSDSAFAQDSNTSYVLNQVVEGLVGLKPGSVSELVPTLAKSWTTSPDGLTYTFELQSGVKFHDGTDFNADAVCYNYNRWNNFTGALASPDYAYYYGAVFGGYGKESNLDSCTANGAGEVVIKLKHPYTSFLLSQTISAFAINSPAALKAGDADNADPTKSAYGSGGTGAMTGTGPFKFKEWVVGDHVTILKNPDYWNAAGKAHLDSVTFRKIADPTAVLNALQAGDIDLATVFNPIDIPVVKTDSELQVITRGDSCNLFHLGMNQTHKPFDNLKIRQAVAYAVNRQNLVDTFYGGNDNANVAKTWMAPATFSAKDESLPEYSVDKAKQLIADSGVPASDLTFDFWYPSEVFRPYMPDPKGIFQAIQTDLEAVGFHPTAQTKPWTGYIPDESTGKYPMWLIGWTCDWAGPDNFLDTGLFYYSKGKPSPEFAYKNDDLNKLMKKAEAETSVDASKPLWEQAQDMIAKDQPTVPLVNSKPVAGAKAYVKGFVGSGGLTEFLNSVWLDK
ncbi:MAG: ABC transporter substrate-binding protein [Chloroflexota bacterium]